MHRSRMDTASPSEPLYPRAASQDETFYDTSEINSPEYDNAVNQGQKAAPTPEELAERERQEAEWRAELAKLEEEIITLQSVLHAKVRQQSELKRKLGITTVTELKQDMQQGIKNIKESNAYQKTNEKVTQFSDTISSTDAYQKTAAAFKTFGAYSSRKMGDLRNSNTFKSIEDKMSGAYTNVKGKVSGSKSENDFEDVLNSAAQAEGDSSPQEGATGSTETKPEEKVPL